MIYVHFLVCFWTEFWLVVLDYHPLSLHTDPIDIVKDPIPPHEYKAEEDPRLYKSVKTKRGPLQEDWIEDFNNNPDKKPIMCAYKLCKVEFRYWGMQSKIERFIHDVGTCPGGAEGRRGVSGQGCDAMSRSSSEM